MTPPSPAPRRRAAAAKLAAWGSWLFAAHVATWACSSTNMTSSSSAADSAGTGVPPEDAPISTEDQGSGADVQADQADACLSPGTVTDSGGLCCSGFTESEGGVPVCAPCGGGGEPCCAGRDPAGACNPGLACAPLADPEPGGAAGVCRACGGAGEPCCMTDAGPRCGTGTRCGPAATCELDDGQACGGNGAPCCSGAACSAGLECDPEKHVCSPCGASGQACCTGDAGDSCGSPALRCVSVEGGPSTCLPCGGSGQPCCKNAEAGNTCTPGLCCISTLLMTSCIACVSPDGP